MVNESETVSPVLELYCWFNENKDCFLSSCDDLEFKDSGRGSACVNLETKKYIVSICAWDHACCLDIQVMVIESEKSSFPHTGDCTSIEEFKNYLKNFTIWFKKETSKNA